MSPARLREDKPARHGHGVCHRSSMKTTPHQFSRTTPPQGLVDWASWARTWLSVDVPQPSPDVVPLPPSPYPVPPPPSLPPGITDPILPGQNEPVRDPTVPITLKMCCPLH